MLKETLVAIFNRDLTQLAETIQAYPSEELLWELRSGISNSGGNLCLHLIGNLNHFIGATLGNTGFVREREKEFTDKNIPITRLVEAIEETKIVVSVALQGLTEADFEADFPIYKRGEPVRTDYMLLHLVTHFNYHLGQINYHRRLLSGENKVTENLL